MSKDHHVTLTFSIRVWDRRELMRAAYAQAEKEGYSRSDYTRLRRESGDRAACDVQMLLDPGVSPPGMEILSSDWS